MRIKESVTVVRGYIEHDEISPTDAELDAIESLCDAWEETYVEAPKSVEQMVRNLLTLAILEGVVREGDPDECGQTDPQAMSAGDLCGLANLLEEYLHDRKGKPQQSFEEWSKLYFREDWSEKEDDEFVGQNVKDAYEAGYQAGRAAAKQ